MNKCSLPSASPKTKSLLLSPFISPKVGLRLRAGRFKIVFKAMIGGALASWLTATIAGILI